MSTTIHPCRGPSRQIDRPKEGYWAVKLRKGAVEVGAAIVRIHTIFDPDCPEIPMDRSPFMVGYINGKIVDWWDVWTRRGREIDKAEYDFLVADRRWAAWHDPGSPEANPYQSIDVPREKPVDPPKKIVDIRSEPPIF